MTELSTGAVAIAIGGLAAILVIAVVVAVFVSKRRIDSMSAGGSDTDVARRIDDIHVALAEREGVLGARFAELDSRLANLQESVTGREAALDEQVKGIGRQVQGITALFANDRARGGWAEIGMRRIFELSGMTEGRDFTCQLNDSGVKPDAIVHLPGGRNIVVDAKFPVARYQDALSQPDGEHRDRLLAEQGKELERVGKDLASRGYADLAFGGYVVMYLPSQAVYESAAEAHSELIDRLLAKRVVVAGPTSLYALLLTVGAVITEFSALQQADQILADARELHRRMTTFVGHMSAVGNGLAGAVKAYNGAVGSWGSKVAPQLNRMSEVAGKESPGVLGSVEESIRPVPEEGLRIVG